MENQDLDKYGNLPHHVRQALLATEQTQPSNEAALAEMTDEPVSKAEESAPQGDFSQDNDERPQDSDVTLDDNEVKAWKGRLNKEQQAHKSTSDKLLAEAAARQKAEADAKALQAKLDALTQQFANTQTAPVSEETHIADSAKADAGELNSREPSSATNANATPPSVSFSEDELSELELNLGATGVKLVKTLQAMQSAQPVPQPNVAQVVEQRLNQWQQQQEAQSQAAAFNTALSEQVPELQGLLTNSAFSQFLNEKVIDYMGNNAAGLVGYIGREKRIDLLPKLKTLVDEFNQSQQPPAEPVTAAPSHSGAAINKKPVNGKKKLTPEVSAKMRFLMNTGQVDALRSLQDEYEIE